MRPDEKWMIYGVTEDDFVELERCSEQLLQMGIDNEAIDSIALRCISVPSWDDALSQGRISS
jgi:hypothetical protein